MTTMPSHASPCPVLYDSNRPPDKINSAVKNATNIPPQNVGTWTSVPMYVLFSSPDLLLTKTCFYVTRMCDSKAVITWNLFTRLTTSAAKNGFGTPVPEKPLHKLLTLQHKSWRKRRVVENNFPPVPYKLPISWSVRNRSRKSWKLGEEVGAIKKPLAAPLWKSH